MIHPLRQGCWDGPPCEIMQNRSGFAAISQGKMAIPLAEFSSPCFAHKIFSRRDACPTGRRADGKRPSVRLSGEFGLEFI